MSIDSMIGESATSPLQVAPQGKLAGGGFVRISVWCPDTDHAKMQIKNLAQKLLMAQNASCNNE